MLMMVSERCDGVMSFAGEAAAPSSGELTLHGLNTATHWIAQPSAFDASFGCVCLCHALNIDLGLTAGQHMLLQGLGPLPLPTGLADPVGDGISAVGLDSLDVPLACDLRLPCSLSHHVDDQALLWETHPPAGELDYRHMYPSTFLPAAHPALNQPVSQAPTGLPALDISRSARTGYSLTLDLLESRTEGEDLTSDAGTESSADGTGTLWHSSGQGRATSATRPVPPALSWVTFREPRPPISTPSPNIRTLRISDVERRRPYKASKAQEGGSMARKRYRDLSLEEEERVGHGIPGRYLQGFKRARCTVVDLEDPGKNRCFLVIQDISSEDVLAGES